MPPNVQYDFLLGGKGFMLARGRSKGRAWRRSGVASIPGASSPSESRFGTTQPQVAFREVFDDFSGGAGYPYRGMAPPNGIHWSEGMDCRFPNQAVHCQAIGVATMYDGFDGAQVGGISHLIDLPLTNPVPEVGFGGVFAFGRRENVVGDTDAWIHYPKSNLFPAAFDSAFRSTTDRSSNEGPAAVFGSYLYVGGSSGNFHRFDLDGANKTTGSVALHGFVNAGNRLWAAAGPFRHAAAIRSLVPPTHGSFGLVEADWSATLMVGNGRGPIADMAALGGQVFCGLPDGIYAGDLSGTVVNITGEVGQNANSDNFRDLTIHGGRVVGQHVAGVFAYDPTTTAGSRVRQIGPVPLSARSPVRGICTAVHSFAGWLYAGIWTGSQAYLRAGREVAADDWRWHVLQRMPVPGRIGRIHVDGVTHGSGLPARSVVPRLWAAMEGSFGAMLGNDVGTAPLYAWPIPRADANPLAPDPIWSANYGGSARMDFPAVDRGAPGVMKVGETVEVWADNFLSGSRYADVYYTLDRGARTLLGRAQTSPVSTLLMGSTNGSFPTFRSVELSLESFNTTPGTCQVYRAVVLLGNLRPQYTETIEAVVTAADEAPDRRGTPMRPGAVILDDLREMADPNRLGGQPHRLVDLAGATSYVVLDGLPEESETYQEGSENPELQATIRMVLMTLSQNTQ